MAYQFVNAGSGNDSNAGTTEGAAVATLAQAMANIIAAGDNGSHLIITDSSTYTVTNALGGVPSYAGDRLHIMAKTGSDGMPLVSPVIDGGNSGGTGGSVVAGAVRCTAGWVIRGLTFQNYIINSTQEFGVVYARSFSATEGTPDLAITIEDCTFKHITGSCIDLSEGLQATEPANISRNKFYDINLGGSGSYLVTTGLNSNKRMKVTNNLFYDLQFLSVSDGIVLGGGTRGPDNIISHNTFGTSSVEGKDVASITYPTLPVKSFYGKAEYNIAYAQQMNNASNSSFFSMNNGEANYNITFSLVGQDSSNAPFAGTANVTSSVGNLTSDPLFRGTPNSALVGADAATNSYKLRNTTSPAFDAAIGSSDVTEDITGGNRLALDALALDTGIYDIGCYELTLYSAETIDPLPQISGDFIINRIPNADNQNKRGLQEVNSGVLGHDVDQVPFITALNGAIPTLIRKRPTVYKQDSGKKGI
jgi:hypothetical protein